VEIFYFAQFRELLGRERVQLTLAPGVHNVRSLIVALKQRGAPWAETLRNAAHVQVAVNRTMAGAETPVADGDEVALFPPVTGG
jgi:molybdopterin synthase sulfur carrier subunit